MEWIKNVPTEVWIILCYGIVGIIFLFVVIVGAGYLITIIKGGKASIGKEGVVCDTEEDHDEPKEEAK